VDIADDRRGRPVAAENPLAVFIDLAEPHRVVIVTPDPRRREREPADAGEEIEVPHDVTFTANVSGIGATPGTISRPHIEPDGSEVSRYISHRPMNPRSRRVISA
jgi:hypothetical protein